MLARMRYTHCVRSAWWRRYCVNSDVKINSDFRSHLLSAKALSCRSGEPGATASNRSGIYYGCETHNSEVWALVKRLCWSETTLGPLWEIWILKKLPRDGRVGESQTGVSAAGGTAPPWEKPCYLWIMYMSRSSDREQWCKSGGWDRCVGRAEGLSAAVSVPQNVN